MKRFFLSMLLTVSVSFAFAQTHVTVSGIVVDTFKVFDSSDSAVILTSGSLSNVAATDTVSVHSVAHFSSATAGSHKVITVTSSLTGPQASSYVLDNASFTTYGTIGKRQLYRDSIVLQPVKFYDGTTECLIQFSGIARNYVSHHVLTTIDSCLFDDPNAGTNKPVHIYFGMSGDDAPNYYPPRDTVLQSTILPRILVTKNMRIQPVKTYDRNNSAIIASRGWFTNVLEEDTVYFDLSAWYNDRNVGVHKSIHIHYDIFGPDTMNYQAPDDGLLMNGEIRAIQLAADGGAAEKTKTFDGTTSCTVTVPSQPVGVLDGDQVYLNTMAAYDTCSVGSNHDIIFSYTIYGNDMMNYLAPADSVYCHDGVILPSETGVDYVSVCSIGAYPNPCLGQLSVSVADAATASHVVTLFNMSGTQLLRQCFSGSQTTIDLASLPAGVYLLKVDDSALTKIVKQ